MNKNFKVILWILFIIFVLSATLLFVFYSAVYIPFEQDLDLSCFETANSLKVDRFNDSSCYKDNELNVIIIRDTNSESLKGFIPYIEINGNKTEMNEIKDLPIENDLKEYKFYIPIASQNKSKNIKISIAPIVLDNKDEMIVCQSSIPVEINEC